MKKLHLSTLLVLVYGLISCEGKFEAHDPIDGLEAVTLEFPFNNEICLEGYTKEGIEEIEVTFKWTTVDGADSYGIEVMNSTYTTDFQDKDVNINEAKFLVKNRHFI